VTTAVDSSVLVAGLLPWHEHHGAARAALRKLLSADSEDPQPILPAHAVLEAYSVMTRMPAPFRVPPTQAHELLKSLLRNKVTLVQLSPQDAWRLLDRLPGDDITGGSVYDAVIAEAAHRAGAKRLLTLNVRHFERVAPEGMDVVAATKAKL